MSLDPIGGGEAVKITSAGRPGVLAFQMMAIGYLFGVGLWGLGPVAGRRAWRGFRRGMVVAAAGFALLGLYQYWIGYERRVLAGDSLIKFLLRKSVDAFR